MRRGVVPAAVLLVALCVHQGLAPRPQEMGQLALVRVIGADAVPGGVEVTASTGARGQRQPLTVTARGESFSAAAGSARGLGKDVLYYGHTGQLLLGEEATGTLLRQAVDDLCRRRDVSLGARVWIVRGTARAALEDTSGADAAARLETLTLEGRDGWGAPECSVADLAAALAAGESACLPVLCPDGRNVLQRDGFAVLRRGEIVCFARDDAALGLELLADGGRDRIDVLTLPDGTQVCLALGRVRTRARPRFDGEELTGLAVRIDLPVRVVRSDRALTGEDLDWIEREAGILEGQRAVRTLELAQEWDADFAGMGRRARMGDPLHAGRTAAQWESAFRDLDIRVSAICRVERSMETMGR